MPANATVTAIPAFRALASATKKAMEWQQDACIVDAIAERSIGRVVADALTPMARRTIIEMTLNNPRNFGFSCRNVEISEATQTPFLIAWLFIFQSGNEYLAVHASANATRSETGAMLPDVGAVPVQGWLIDSSQAIDIARKAGATERQGYFRVKMWNVNSEWVPLWTMPFQMQDGTPFVIRADTGQILTADSEEAIRDGKWKPY